MPIDIALDPDTHDLLFQNNGLVLVDSADQLKQNLKQNILFFLGEWFLGTNKGVPWFENILVKNPNLPNIDNIIKAVIKDTRNITDLIEYKSDFNSIERNFSITFKSQSIFGVVELSISIF